MVIPYNNNIVCLICKKKISVCKQYSVKRHYTTKHSESFDKLLGQFRLDKILSLKQGLSEQQLQIKNIVFDAEISTKVSFLIAENIAKRGKPFSDGEFVKECLKSFVVNVCPKEVSVFEQISLSRQTVTRRIEDIADNIESTLKSRIGKCELFSLALDGGTDIKDTNQMTVMIRGVTDEFDIVEELLDISSMKGRTTGKNVHDAVMCVSLDTRCSQSLRIFIIQNFRHQFKNLFY